MARRNGLKIETRVTVVPVINVSLVVVLTLMVIAPFLSGEDQEIDLPQAMASQADDTDNIEIMFTHDRRVLIDEAEIAIGDLPDLLANTFAMMPHSVAVVKADQSLPYGEVETLIAAIEEAGAPRIALATKPKQEEAGR